MKKINSKNFVIIVAILFFILIGCQKKLNDNNKDIDKPVSNAHKHNHPLDGGLPPNGIKEATNPLFPIGSKVIVKADHMPNMNGIEAKIVGAFKTYTYSVNYTPTNGDKDVLDHKWIVHEEVENYGKNKLADGTKIKINANHMYGMQNAMGTIAYSTEETVYMIDFEVDGMLMKNHKWVVESELVKP